MGRGWGLDGGAPGHRPGERVRLRRPRGRGWIRRTWLRAGRGMARLRRSGPCRPASARPVARPASSRPSAATGTSRWTRPGRSDCSARSWRAGSSPYPDARPADETRGPPSLDHDVDLRASRHACHQVELLGPRPPRSPGRTRFSTSGSWAAAARAARSAAADARSRSTRSCRRPRRAAPASRTTADMARTHTTPGPVVVTRLADPADRGAPAPGTADHGPWPSGAAAARPEHRQRRHAPRAEQRHLDVDLDDHQTGAVVHLHDGPLGRRAACGLDDDLEGLPTGRRPGCGPGGVLAGELGIAEPQRGEDQPEHEDEDRERDGRLGRHRPPVPAGSGGVQGSGAVQCHGHSLVEGSAGRRSAVRTGGAHEAASRARAMRRCGV